jgi:hypothetical protein
MPWLGLHRDNVQTASNQPRGVGVPQDVITVAAGIFDLFGCLPLQERVAEGIAEDVGVRPTPAASQLSLAVFLQDCG